MPLYERRPFRLTLAGQKLSAFLQPMFEGLPALIQYKVRLSDPEWIDWPEPLTADLSQHEITARDPSPAASPQMYIRVRLDP